MTIRRSETDRVPATSGGLGSCATYVIQTTTVRIAWNALLVKAESATKPSPGMAHASALLDGLGAFATPASQDTLAPAAHSAPTAVQMAPAWMVLAETAAAAAALAGPGPCAASARLGSQETHAIRVRSGSLAVCVTSVTTGISVPTASSAQIAVKAIVRME